MLIGFSVSWIGSTKPFSLQQITQPALIKQGIKRVAEVVTGEVYLDTAGCVFGGKLREIAEECGEHGMGANGGQPVRVAPTGKSHRTNE